MIELLTVIGVLVIGLGASIASFPAGALSIPSRIASVFGLGCAVPILVGSVLVLLGLFGVAVISGTLITVTIALWVVGLRRSSIRAHVDALHTDDRSQTLWTLLGLAVLITIAIAAWRVPVIPHHGAWRYWADGLELADVGEIPPFSAQWGMEVPPAISKFGGNSFLGMLSLFGFRTHPHTGMAVALWLSTVGLAAGAWALGHEVGLRRLAPALPLVMVAGARFPGDVILNEEVVIKLGFFEHENLGRMLAFAAAALAIAAIRGKTPLVGAVAAGATLAAAALTHLIPVLVAVSFVVGAALVRIVTASERSAASARVATVVGVGVLLSAVPLLLARGDIGFQGASASANYELFEGELDPTAKVQDIERPPRPKSASRWYEPPGTTLNLAAERALGRSVGGVVAAVIGVAVVAAAIFLVRQRDETLQMLGAGSAAAIVAMIAVALVFSFRHSFFAPATFGERRLFEYASIPLILLTLGALEVALRALPGRRKSTVSAATAGVLIVFGVAAWSGLRPEVVDSPSPYVAAAVETPCDARLLTDRPRHKGTHQALAGRISIVEGLAPYLRPTIINRALELRADQERFFDDPKANSNFLSEQEVDFVVGRRSRALDEASTLNLERTVDAVGLYSVQDAVGAGELPTPQGSPGYTCFTEAPDD